MTRSLINLLSAVFASSFLLSAFCQEAPTHIEPFIAQHLKRLWEAVVAVLSTVS